MANSQPTKDREEIQFRQLLEEAVSKPGTLMKAYSLFWNYSLGNQILALIQANQRSIPLGPIASFNRSTISLPRNGFSMKSSAPFLMARTAMAISPCPEIMKIGAG